MQYKCSGGGIDFRDDDKHCIIIVLQERKAAAAKKRSTPRGGITAELKEQKDGQIEGDDGVFETNENDIACSIRIGVCARVSSIVFASTSCNLPSRSHFCAELIAA